MYISLVVTICALVITTFILKRLFELPRNIWVLFLAQPLMMSSGPVIVFIGGILASEMVEDKSLATLPVTFMILGVASAAFPAAVCARKFGRKIASLIGFGIGLLASLLAAYAAYQLSFTLFTLASMMIGVCTAFVQQLRFAAIESINNKDKIPTVLSILMLSGIFAAFIGPEIALVGKDLVDSPHGFTGSFIMLSFLVLIAMFIFLAFSNPTSQSQSIDKSPRPTIEIIKQPIFIISVVAAALGFALMSYVMTATPLSMHHVHGHSLSDTKWVIQSHIAAMFIPSLFTAILVKKLGLHRLMLIGTFIYTFVALIALSGEQVVHYWWALLLLGIGWNFLFLTGTSLLPQSYEENERHKVQAINDFIIFGSQAAASLLAGWVLFKAGWYAVILSTAPFIFILFWVSWRYWRYQKAA